VCGTQVIEIFADTTAMLFGDFIDQVQAAAAACAVR
jgi:hypothetical protein